MKFHIILLLIISQIQSCKSQDAVLYKHILHDVRSECDSIKAKLSISDECSIQLSSKVIAINVTPFNDVLDSLRLIKKDKNTSSFEAANTFDLDNYQEAHINKDLERLQQKSDANVKLYCSYVFDGLITCEVTEKSNSNDELIFGQSILFLYKVVDSHKVEQLGSVVLNNN